MKTRFIAFLLLFVMNLGVFAQSSYQPTEENLKARQEFQDNKFGIFLHWGLYAMLATGEWTMTNNNLNYKEYAKLAGGFYPSKFDADKWVAAIKASGAKYICFTTRHHEGFSMFDTKYSDYNVVKATPFKRDIVKELAAACAKLLPVYWAQIPAWLLISAAFVLYLKMKNAIACFAMHKKLITMHTLLNRAVGILLFAFPFACMVIPIPVYGGICAAAAFVATVDAFVRMAAKAF